eukprot:scaffold37919_cov35-Tisochrysis_lutea.AAC.1
MNGRKYKEVEESSHFSLRPTVPNPLLYGFLPSERGAGGGPIKARISPLGANGRAPSNRELRELSVEIDRHGGGGNGGRTAL